MNIEALISDHSMELLTIDRQFKIYIGDCAKRYYALSSLNVQDSWRFYPTRTPIHIYLDLDLTLFHS